MRMVGLLGGGYAAFQQKLAAMAAAQQSAASPEGFGGGGRRIAREDSGEPLRRQPSGQGYAVLPGSKLKVVYSDNQRPVSPAQAHTYQRLSEQGVFDPKARQGSPTHPLAEREGFQQPPGTSMVRYQDGRIVYLPTQAEWERESEHFTRHVHADVQRFGSIPYGSESLVDRVFEGQGLIASENGAGAPAALPSVTPLDPLTEKFCKAVDAMDTGGDILSTVFGGAESAARAANRGRMLPRLDGLFSGPGRFAGVAEEAFRAGAEMRQGTPWQGALAGAAARIGVDATGTVAGTAAGAAAGSFLSGNPVGTAVGGVSGGVVLPIVLDEMGVKDWAGDIAAGFAAGRRRSQCP